MVLCFTQFVTIRSFRHILLGQLNKGREIFWVLGKRRIAAWFRPLDIDTYMYGTGEGTIKEDLIGMVYEDMDGIQIAGYDV